MKRLILHIGTHKTGTTSLQQFLSDNAGLLHEQGITYPRLPKKYSNAKRSRNAYPITVHARRLIGARSLPLEFEELTEANLLAIKQAVEGSDTVLLSDEQLWYDGAVHPETWQIVRKLLQELGVDEIEIVVYFRRQDLFIDSYWNQSVKSGSRFRASLATYSKKETISKVGDYDAGLRVLEEVFGQENLRVRVYERDKLVGGDIVKDFCELIGIEIGTGFVFRPVELNPRMNGTVAELKRQVNFLECYRQTDNFLRFAADQATLVDGGRDATSALSPKVSERIRARYEEGNARVALRYFGRDDGQLFSPDPVGEVAAPEIGSEAFARATVRFFAAALSDEHAKRLEAEARLADLEKRLKALEKRGDALETREAKLESRVSDMRWSMGLLGRVRLKLYRKRRRLP